ncbi:zeta toxin family protein [Kribbella sp. NPDC049174]
MISDATAPPALFIMGSPGAGKSTLSELLAERLRMVEIRSGEILRNLAAD